MTTPLRFGVLGAARIAPKALIQPAGTISTAVVTRVAARDGERAREFALEHGIAAASDSYEALITADDVDVVYNPLPMSLHAEWTIAALQAGKHVLCEKPFASNAEEAEAMVRASEDEGLLLGEAFHYRYHPMFQRLIDLVGSGTIGDVTRIDGRFDVPIAKPDIRWDYATSGGSLMDLGCYPMSWVRHLTGQEPEVVSAEAVEDPADIDASISAELRFASGTTARIQSSMLSGPVIELTIEGTEGRIDAVNPLAPQNGNLLTIETADGTTAGPVEAGSSYDHMLRAFVDHVVHDAPFPTKGQDSIANMVAIDAVYEAAGLRKRGARVEG